MKYYCKFDFKLIILMIALLLATFTILYTASNLLILNIIVMLVFVLCVWIVLSAHYVISGHDLIAKFGPFKHKISIDKIQKIKSGHGGKSRKITSKSSLELLMNDGVMVISPRKHYEIVEAIVLINPKIKFEI